MVLTFDGPFGLDASRSDGRVQSNQELETG
jgi:hypothetical protein